MVMSKFDKIDDFVPIKRFSGVKNAITYSLYKMKDPYFLSIIYL